MDAHRAFNFTVNLLKWIYPVTLFDGHVRTVNILFSLLFIRQYKICLGFESSKYKRLKDFNFFKHLHFYFWFCFISGSL
jgi:hypothetical protein